MLNSKLQKLKDHFGITTPHDWQAVRPDWILSLDGIGPKTLDYLRLLLAHRDITLKGDRTPEYWRQHLSEAQVVDSLGNEEVADEADLIDRGVVLPFTVLVDTAEQHPFTFQGFRTDAADERGGGRPIIVPTEFQSLGRFPDSLGDYSLDSPIGGFGKCHVERKSMQDAHSTILGWAKKGEDGGRRERFERELAALSEMEAGLVVVECSFMQLIGQAPEYGRRTAAQNAKTLYRSIIAWQQDYPVAWVFAEDRRMAEKTTFTWLRRWFEKGMEARKAELKEEVKRRKELQHGPQLQLSEKEVDRELAAL